MEKQSFILGMITAFCECVAGGCKQLLSYNPEESVHTGYDAYRTWFPG